METKYYMYTEGEARGTITKDNLNPKKGAYVEITEQDYVNVDSLLASLFMDKLHFSDLPLYQRLLGFRKFQKDMKTKALNILKEKNAILNKLSV